MTNPEEPQIVRPEIEKTFHTDSFKALVAEKLRTSSPDDQPKPLGNLKRQSGGKNVKIEFIKFHEEVVGSNQTNEQLKLAGFSADFSSSLAPKALPEEAVVILDTKKRQPYNILY